MNKFPILLFFVISFVNAGTVAITNSQTKLINKSSLKFTNDSLNIWIEATVEKRMKEHNIPAVSVGIIRDGKISYANGFGIQNRVSSKSVEKNSIYQIASLGKTFTGIIVNNLINESKLDLNEHITIYLSELLTESSKQSLKNVKLKNLLENTSGIPDYSCSIYNNWKANDNWTAGYSEKELIRDINAINLEFTPGSKFSYSNSGFVIASFICEKVSGKTYEQLLKNYVTDRYGLENTGLSLNDQQKPLLVTAYNPDQRNNVAKSIVWGKAASTSGIYSTVNDLLKLMLVHLSAYQQYHTNGKRNPLILTDLPKADNSLIPRDDMKLYYSLGLMKAEDEHGLRYNNGGDSDGYSVEYTFIPKLDIGVLTMTSSGGNAYTELNREINFKLQNRVYEAPKRSLAQSFVNEILANDISSGITLFQKLKSSTNYYIKEDEINQVGYALLNMKRIEDAIEVFKLNVIEFPLSANVYDSLAEAYLNDGNKVLAILNYKKSLEINPNNMNGINALKKLKEE